MNFLLLSFAWQLGTGNNEKKQESRQEWNENTVKNNSMAEHTTLSNDHDVSSRLAALKAKLAVQGSAPHPNALDLAPLRNDQPFLRTASGNNGSAPAISHGGKQQEQKQEEEQGRTNRATMASLYNPSESDRVDSTSVQTSHVHGDAANRQVGTGDEELRITKSLLAEERNKSSALESTLEGLQRRLEEAVSKNSAHQQDAHRMGELEREVARLETDCNNLRAEVERLRSENDKEQKKCVDEGQNAVAKLQLELEEAQAALGHAETEKTALKSQLTRLKTQMLSEQNDLEEEVKLRVDAEVKLAMEKLSSVAQESGLAEKQRAQELVLALERAERAEKEAAKLEQVCASRDLELANMQRVLGELSFEADVAEKLRGELRILQSELLSARLSLEDLEKAKAQADDLVSSANTEIGSLKATINMIKETEAKSRRETLEAQMKAQAFARQLEELKVSTGNSLFKKETILHFLASILPIVRRKKDVVALATRYVFCFC